MKEAEAIERIVLLGPDSSVKRMIQSALEQSSAAGTVACVQQTDGSGKSGDGSCARQTAELTREDYALLFGCYAADQDSQNARWFEELTEAIIRIQNVRPRSVLFISDRMVYGKVFGEQHLLREDEIGYVCHTSADDTTAQWMRTAEHFCARLAREEALPVKIVRADWEHIPVMLQKEGESTTILNTILGILKDGIAGEAYNISGLTADILARKNAECAKTRSPLAPVTVLPDIRKAENYAAS